MGRIGVLSPVRESESVRQRKAVNVEPVSTSTLASSYIRIPDVLIPIGTTLMDVLLTKAPCWARRGGCVFALRGWRRWQRLLQRGHEARGMHACLGDELTKLCEEGGRASCESTVLEHCHAHGRARAYKELGGGAHGRGGRRGEHQRLVSDQWDCGRLGEQAP